jgi:flagellar secretion chaperone FliS
MTDVQADSHAHRDYKESRILSAHPVEVVHMLYQVAIDNLNGAILCLRTGDHFERGRQVSKAQGAVDELMFAVDPEKGAPLGRNLAELYDYVQRQIISGHTRRSEASFRDALAILTTLSEGWSGVRTKLMGESQAVQSAPEAQAEAVPAPVVNGFYGEFRAEGSTRDWSC